MGTNQFTGGLRTARVRSSQFTAKLTLRRNRWGILECVAADKRLHYLIGMSIKQVELRVRKRGWQLEWVKQMVSSSAGV